MKACLSVLCAALLAVAVPAYAQSSPVTVDTTEQSYGQGESIIVYGQVAAPEAGYPVLLRLLEGDNIVGTAQIEVAQDGTFTYLFRTNAQFELGLYRVIASYDKDSADAEFVMTAPTSPVDDQDDPKDAVPVDCTRSVDGGPLGGIPVVCSITGGTVNNIMMDVNNLGMIVDIVSDSDGTISLDLPSGLIDARDENGNSIGFIVRVDNVQVDHRESVSEFSRSLEVDFIQGERTIEITGTMAVPEFGTVAMIVTALGLAAVIAIKRPGLLASQRTA